MYRFLLTLLLSATLLFLACSEDEDDSGTIVGPDDVIQPSTISDLTAGSPAGTSITLTWTSPGDDGIVGRARTYDIRYSTSTITEQNWDGASTAIGEPYPKVVGYEETFTVGDLDPTTTYYFCIRAGDDANNWSDLSNISSMTTLMLGEWTLYNTGNSEIPNDTILAICLDANKYFGSPAGLIELDGLDWSLIDVVGEDSTTNIVTDVAVDASGAVWVATQADGVTKIEGHFTTRITDSTSGLTVNSIRSIVVNNDLDIWFGTGGGGICLLTEGFLWTLYNTETSNLIFNGINKLVFDNAGSLWAATNIGGVSKMVGDNFINYNSSDCPPLGTVWNMAFDDDGNGWFGTNGGVCKFDGSSWTYFNVSNSDLVSNVVTSIAVDAAGDLWFGTWDGLSRFDGSTWRNYTSQNSVLPNNYIRALVADAGGNIWIGTNGGVAVFHD